jgi:MoxR-like ATPase
MQEAQVSVEGESFRLEPPFVVIATQNPIELEGTYPLPEAQLDRFLMRVAVGYPSPEEEREILERRRRRRQDDVDVAAVVSRDDVLAMQRALEDVFVSDTVERYVVDLVQATRTDHRIALGASPRGALALLKLARAWAVLRGRDFVTPDDVKAMAGSALAHRLILQPELWVSKLSSVQVVDDLLTQVPAPKAEVG